MGWRRRLPRSASQNLPALFAPTSVVVRTLTFDATNLLDSVCQDYFGPSSNLHPRDTRLHDRTYEFGGRYRF